MDRESKHIFLSAITALAYPFTWLALFGGMVSFYFAIITLEITQGLIGIGLILIAAVFWVMYKKLSPGETTSKSKWGYLWSLGVIAFILWLNNYVYH